MAEMTDVPVSEVEIGPGLPALKIGTGPRPLVYLPGLSLHPGHPKGQERSMAISGWDPLLDRYTIYRTGRRVRPVGVTFDDMAADAAGAMEQLGAPVDLMGASTGGLIALHVAARRPELVRRLVVVISGTRFGDAGRRMGEEVIRAVSAGRWRRVFATILPIGAKSAPGRLGWAAFGWLLGPRVIGVPSDPTLLLAELAAWDRVDADPLLERITCPTLVIGTALDRVFPPAATQAFGGRLAIGTVVIVPRVAHDFPADAMVRHISPFLE